MRGLTSGYSVKVLIAEDDAISRRLVDSSLSMWGYEAICVGDGQEAWGALQQEGHPQIAVLDWMMPNMSGLEVCRRLRSRKEGQYVYVIFLTARGRKEDVLEAMEAGADDYIAKPFDMADLKVRLRAGRRIVELQHQIREESKLRTRHQQEHARELQRSHDQLQSIIDGISEPILTIDPEGKILAANRVVREHLGGRDPVADGMTCSDVYHASPDEVCDSVDHPCPLEKVKRSGKPFSATHRHRGPDGKVKIVDILASPVTGEDGEIRMVVECHRDVTRHHQIEQALRERQAELEALFDSVPMPILLVDENCRVHKSNGKIAESFDYEGRLVRPGEVLRCIHALDEDEDGCGKTAHCADCELRGAVRQTLEEGARMHGLEAEIQTHSTEEGDCTRCVLVHSTPVTLADQRMALVCIQDITQRKDAENQIRASAESLRKANDQLTETQAEVSALNANLEAIVEERTSQVHRLLEQKDSFINQMAHDLKTPLTPLVALVPMLRRSLPDEPKLNRALEILTGSVDYMRHLVDRTLRLARLSAPSLEFQCEPMDLMVEFRNVLAAMELSMQERDVHVDNRIVAPVVVQADRIYLRELMENLLSNALKYMDPGGTITIEANASDDDVIVGVTDTGAGMSPEQCQQVFEEFFKVDESRTDHGSTGLGLSICRRIVERHGGIIWAESDGSGEGSTFFFTLKSAEAEVTVN